MLTHELDYELPPELIATEPAAERDGARLMVIDRQSNRIEHRHVRDLPKLVSDRAIPMAVPQPGDLLVLNRSRVLPASFKARRTATGGQVNGLYLASPPCDDGCHWLVMLEARGKLQAHEQLDLTDDATLQLVEPRGNGQWLAKLESVDDTTALLERIGQPPLPPYIQRQRRLLQVDEIQTQDKERYNTVYATDGGSVAAPTAGLHFTTELLTQLEQLGIQHTMATLHVGLGTFAPVRSDRLEDHVMHREQMTIPATTIAAIQATRKAGGRIIPIGTTTVRALESLPTSLPTTGDFTTSTDLFIAPSENAMNGSTAESSGFSFRYTDALMTNFHLPRSTLLAMVAALPGVGLTRLKQWYQLAIKEQYRFYSYGDAMLLL